LRAEAVAAQRQGRFEAAIAGFRQSVQAAPREADGYVALAGCLLVARRPEVALQVCDVGLREAGAGAPLFCAKARILQTLSRVGEAAATFRAALDLDDGCAEARFGLALQAMESGAWDEAAALNAPLLAGPNADPATQWLAARIALGRGEFAAARTHAERALASGALAPDQMAETALLQGEALDGLGRPSEAFAAFSRGKSALRAFYAERAAAAEPEIGKFERLQQWFAAADPAPWQVASPLRAGDGARGHAFLVGFPRSGTTLLEQALAGHPDVVALEEAPTLAEAYGAFLADAAGLERLARLPADETEQWRAVYWRTVRAHGADPTGRIFVDKAPAGTLYLPLIAKLFPDARVLFALRDPRDVVLSCFRSSFQMNALTYAFVDLAEAARSYAACMSMAETYRRVLPLHLREVRYERLVDDFAGELAAVAAFLGLALAPGMADVAATAQQRVVRTPSAPQVRAGLNRQGLGRWRAYAAELAPVLPILKPWLQRFGYESAAGGGAA
jgi:thioredoxin-like negative regulator of GroEL